MLGGSEQKSEDFSNNTPEKEHREEVLSPQPSPESVEAETDSNRIETVRLRSELDKATQDLLTI